MCAETLTSDARKGGGQTHRNRCLHSHCTVEAKSHGSDDIKDEEQGVSGRSQARGGAGGGLTDLTEQVSEHVSDLGRPCSALSLSRPQGCPPRRRLTRSTRPTSSPPPRTQSIDASQSITPPSLPSFLSLPFPMNNTSKKTDPSVRPSTDRSM